MRAAPLLLLGLIACGPPAASTPSPEAPPTATAAPRDTTAWVSIGKRAAAGTLPDPFTRDPDVRSALATLERLHMILAYREVAPGVLQLAIGDGWNPPGAEYHLSHLYGGYAGLMDRGVPVVVELWDGEKKFGEYSKDGLLVGPEFTGPRRAQ